VALEAFIDESGQRGVTRKSSDHFVMSAVVCRDVNVLRTRELLDEIRAELGRQPRQRLHWTNFKPDQRVKAAQILGGASYLKIASVVACKRLLPPTIPNDDAAYLYTFRFLLERLSWLAKQEKTELSYTLSHVRGFHISELRQYEEKLRKIETEIKWKYIAGNGSLAYDTAIEQLQLADTAASATAAAFEPGPTSEETNQDYLRSLAPRLYRRRWPGPNALTSYGLKMHPWDDAAKAAYPWVRSL
jgi:hypothetical protein